MNKKYWIGVDLSKQIFEAALVRQGTLPEKWAKCPVKAFRNDQEEMAEFLAWLEGEGISKGILREYVLSPRDGCPGNGTIKWGIGSARSP